MKMKLIAALLALAFGLSAAAVVRAEEAAKSDPMYSAKCPSPCSFSVKSHDKAEVVAILQEHAKSHHNGMALSDADAAAMVKVVEPKK